MAFRAGQKVICVDASIGPFKSAGGVWDALISVDEIYTIRWVGDYEYRGPYGTITAPCVRLRGITRPDNLHGEDDRPFAASRFRALVEKKTSIEIFQQIRLGVRKPEGVEA